MRFMLQQTANLKIMVFDRFLGDQFLMVFSPSLDKLNHGPLRCPKNAHGKNLFKKMFVGERAACVHSQWGVFR